MGFARMEEGDVLDARTWLMAWLPVLAIVLAAAAPARTALPVRLNFDDCREAPVRLKALLKSGWPPWDPYIQMCPLSAPNGAKVLSILTVRVDHVAAAQVAESRPIPFPGAIVLDASDAPVGQLASAVPDGPPGTSVVSFTDWRNGFPHRIQVRRINAAVRGTFNEKPLVWNAMRKQFE